MTTFSDLLPELTAATRTNRDKGTLFERLIKKYLETDPQYADRLAAVWLWSEWPDHGGPDVGIDLNRRCLPPLCLLDCYEPPRFRVTANFERFCHLRWPPILMMDSIDHNM